MSFLLDLSRAASDKHSVISFICIFEGLITGSLGVSLKSLASSIQPCHVDASGAVSYFISHLIS